MSTRLPLPSFLRQRVLPSHNAREAKLALLKDLLEASGGDAGLTHMVVRRPEDDLPRFFGITSLNAPPAFEKVASAMEGQRVPPVKASSITTANQFEVQTAKHLPEEFYRQVWQPSAIHSCLGTNLLDDEGNHAAWIGVFRRGESPPFEPRDASTVSSRLTPYRDLMMALTRMCSTDPGDALLVMSETGAVLMASGQGEAWLALPGFREALLRDLESLHQERAAQRRTHFRTASITLTRVDGKIGRGYVATISRSPRTQMRPVFLLTRGQREVVDLAGLGASTKEIAQQLGKSQETIRSHLRAIYEQLGISTRAELALALSQGF